MIRDGDELALLIESSSHDRPLLAGGVLLVEFTGAGWLLSSSSSLHRSIMTQSSSEAAARAGCFGFGAAPLPEVDGPPKIRLGFPQLKRYAQNKTYSSKAEFSAFERSLGLPSCHRHPDRLHRFR